MVSVVAPPPITELTCEYAAGVARRNSTYLLILGDREGVAWVLRTARMAFTASRARMARSLRPGDRLFLYTTRGCFHNPTRDRGRVIGEATVGSSVVEFEAPVRVAGRAFELGCELEIVSLAPVHEGVELAPLVPHLLVFPDPSSWSAVMRRPILALPSADAVLIARRLDKVATTPAWARAAYLDAASPQGRRTA